MAGSVLDPAANGQAGSVGTADAEPSWRRIAGSAPIVPAPRRRRSRGLIALGIALMAVCAAGAVALYTGTSTLQQSVGVAVRVPFGATVEESDLVPVQVHPDPAVRAVPWDQRGSVVGQRAATDLLPGSVLSTGMVGGVSVPNAGQSLVGVAVKPAQLPATPLKPRDRVLLVGIGGPLTATGNGAIEGTVVVVGPSGGSGERVVDVEVPGSRAVDLAAQAAAGKVAIVLQPRG